MPQPLVVLAEQLIANGIRFRYLRRFGRVIKPQAVSLEITHRCIARCIMCNIWRIPKNTPALSVDEWLSLLSKDLFTELVELDITGGEPFLRKDLADLLTGVCKLNSSPPNLVEIHRHHDQRIFNQTCCREKQKKF
jgi:organic radical activating enzyme